MMKIATGGNNRSYINMEARKKILYFRYSLGE
jgi:hypothetical protein